MKTKFSIDDTAFYFASTGVIKSKISSIVINENGISYRFKSERHGDLLSQPISEFMVFASKEDAIERISKMDFN